MSLRAVTVVVCGAALLVGGIWLAPTVPTEGAPLSSLVLGLAVVLTAAKLSGDLAKRLGQPPVLGELIIGIVLGNLPGTFFHSISENPPLNLLAELGVLLLLFQAGLESTVREVFSFGLSALFAAFLGTVGSFVAGFAVSRALLPQAPFAVHVFLGAAITPTSVGITARVLRDLGASRRSEAKIILGASFVDDLLALLALTLVAGWIGRAHTAVGATEPILAMVLKTIGFLAVAVVLGVQLTPFWFRHAARLKAEGVLVAVGLCFCFFLAWGASAIGLQPLIGAFAAGLVLEETHSQSFVARGERSLNEQLEPIAFFLVPIFFVVTGMRTQLSALFEPSSLALAIALTMAAIVGKLACAVGLLGAKCRRLMVAIGMIPRGEVTLIFAALGIAATHGGTPLLDQRAYSALIAVVALTTLITPIALKWTSRGLST